MNLIKFSHTVFALPFALIGTMLGFYDIKLAHLPSPNYLLKVLLILGCMIFARSAAMGFNRYIDRKFDALNPRTSMREIPAGIISSNNALWFVVICSLCFVACTYFINMACFFLSPIAILVILGYSYTKRFTPLCHLVLGVGLALAPVGAYIAVSGKFGFVSILFGIVVFTWVSAFDIMYACQDYDFDRSQQLKSIPVWLGVANALKLSNFIHIITFVLLIVLYFLGNFSWWYIAGAGIFSTLLYYQHSIVSARDLSRINLAFGTTNGIASIVFSIFVILDILLRYIAL